MAGLNGWEFVLLAILAVFLLGDRMPEYAAKLARFIQTARTMAEGAKGQLKEQLGPEFEDINWRQYDPRQYDPRRIVRQALLEPLEDATAGVREAATTVLSDSPVPSAMPSPSVYHRDRATPFDTDAT